MLKVKVNSKKDHHFDSGFELLLCQLRCLPLIRLSIKKIVRLNTDYCIGCAMKKPAFGLLWVKDWAPSSLSSFKGYELQARHKQGWVECLSFYYPRLLYCPDQMLAVMLLS